MIIHLGYLSCFLPMDAITDSATVFFPCVIVNCEYLINTGSKMNVYLSLEFVLLKGCVVY